MTTRRTTMLFVHVAIITAVLAATIACTESKPDGATGSDCPGDRVDAPDDVTACLIDNDLIIESGFECARDQFFYEGVDVSFCADGPIEEEWLADQPGYLEERPGNNGPGNNGPGNNGPANNGPGNNGPGNNGPGNNGPGNNGGGDFCTDSINLIVMPSGPVGSMNTVTFWVSNCGSVDLDVLSVEIIEDEGGDFTLGLPRLPLTLEPGERTDMTVTVAPDGGPIAGTILVTTNNPNQPEREIPIEAATGECPTTIDINGSAVESGGGTDVSLGSTTTMMMSVPGAEEVEWALDVTPIGSTSTIETEILGAGEYGALLNIDVVGLYTVSATAVFPQMTCVPVTVDLLAETNDTDLHVQLVWDVENIDLDLHLAHENATSWGQSPWDCYSLNANPSWGPESDDPRLDIDDTDGFGPENINWNSDSGARTFAGVKFAGDRGADTTATVRIFRAGELIFEQSRLMLRDDFWEVAVVEANAASVTEVDELHDGPEEYPALSFP